jgi:hypothetical protein
LLDALDANGDRIVSGLDGLVEHGGVIDVVGKGHVIVVLPLFMNLQEHFLPLAESVLLLLENGNLGECTSRVHLYFILAKLPRVGFHVWCGPRCLSSEAEELLPVLLIQILEQALGGSLPTFEAIEGVLILTAIRVSADGLEFLPLRIQIAVFSRGKRGLIKGIILSSSCARPAILREGRCVRLKPPGSPRFG